MNIVMGDILEIGKGGVICHQVNCQKVAGSGLARQIRNRIAGWYGHFKTINGSLGDVDYFHVGDTVIASLYGQDKFGSGGKWTDYSGLFDALETAKVYCGNHHKQMYIPYGIGCGLGGGDWSIVSEYIDVACPGAIVVKPEEK